MSPPRRHDVVPVSAPARVLERLQDAPNGPVPVLHRGRHAVYVRVGDRCVGVVGRAAAQVPCAVRTRLPDLDAFATGAAHVDDGVLVLDGRPLVPGRVCDVGVPRLTARPRGTPGLTAEQVATMIGAGEGLTPYADDVLAGWLAAHRAVGIETPVVDRAVRENLARTTLLSATLLDCALHGEALPELATYLSVVGSSHEAVASHALEAVGHTSGAGLLAGARRALAGLELWSDGGAGPPTTSHPARAIA